MNKIYFYFYYKKWKKHAKEDMSFFETYKNKIENPFVHYAVGNLQYVPDSVTPENDAQYLYNLCKKYDPLADLNFPLFFKTNDLNNRHKLKATHFTTLEEMQKFLIKYYQAYFDKLQEIIKRLNEVKTAEKEKSLPPNFPKVIPYCLKMINNFDKNSKIMQKITQSFSKVYEIEALYNNLKQKYYKNKNQIETFAIEQMNTLEKE